MVRAIRAEGDVLFVPPVRDGEFAKVMLEEAEDACLISEMTAKDCADAIARFVQFSGDPILSAERLHGVISQKLVRQRPTSLAQAAAMDGITPAALLLLRAHVKRTRQSKGA